MSKEAWAYAIRPGICTNLDEFFKDDPGRKLLPSELKVFNHVQFYSHFYRNSGVIPFRQRQETIARKLGITRKTVNVAFQRLVEKGVFQIQRRARHCNLLRFGARMMKAFRKVHAALHHVGLTQHIEKCCIEAIRRKHRVKMQGDGGFEEGNRRRREEEEERKREQWRRELAESTGRGAEMFRQVVAGLTQKMSMA